MELGISLSTGKFLEEKGLLAVSVDFFEVLLPGDRDVSNLVGCGERILIAHLPDLNRNCFGALSQANDLKAEKAVIHFHTAAPMGLDEKIETLNRLYKKAEIQGMTLCLENTEESVDQLGDLFKTMPELRFCLDVGHANLFSNDPVDFIDSFKDRLVHVHIHDNIGGDSERDDLHLPPGEGTIDFPRVLTSLKSIGYSGAITLELAPSDDVRLKAESLSRLREMLAHSTLN
jgi:sugar phosphate isomerase/epimerase